MNANGLFRGPNDTPDPGISQADLMREIGHGKGDNPKVFRQNLQS